MGEREDKMITVQTDSEGRPTVWCDPEVADLVTALCLGGVSTAASCSGHGHRPGSIVLKDGRHLMILSREEFERVNRLFPTDINGVSRSPEMQARLILHAYGVERVDDIIAHMSALFANVEGGEADG